jgi:hypothetical protein
MQEGTLEFDTVNHYIALKRQAEDVFRTLDVQLDYTPVGKYEQVREKAERVREKARKRVERRREALQTAIDVFGDAGLYGSTAPAPLYSVQVGDVVVVKAYGRKYKGSVLGVTDRDTAGEYVWADVQYGKYRESFRLPSGKSVLDPNRIFLTGYPSSLPATCGCHAGDECPTACQLWEEVNHAYSIMIVESPVNPARYVDYDARLKAYRLHVGREHVPNLELQVYLERKWEEAHRDS